MEEPAQSSQPQKIQIEVVNKQNEAPDPSNTERKDTGVEYKYNVEYQRFCDDLGIDKYKRDGFEVAQKVSLIYDWAKEQVGSEDGNKISLAIRDLVRTLGIQNIQGELLADNLFRWIRIDMAGEQNRVKNMEKEMIDKELQIKQEIKKIEPKISDEELETRIKEGMKDVQAKIKKRVKSYLTASINKGIKEAIQKAAY